MTLLLNSAEGITPSGTTPTNANSGGVSGNAFDTAAIGNPPAGGTLASDSTHAAHGALSIQFATAGTAGTAFVGWTTSMGSQAQVWFRLYLFITGNPANVLRLFSALQGSTGCASIALTTGGLIRQLSSTGATIQTGTVAVPANQWVRIEGFIIGSATVGQVQHKLFKSADSTTADETLTSAATQNTTGSMNVYRFGLATSLASAGPYWMDDLGLSSTGYVNPDFFWTAAAATSPVLADQVSRTLAVTAGTAAAMANQASKVLTATVTTAAALARQAGKSLRATVTTSASATSGKAFLLTLAAVVTTAGFVSAVATRVRTIVLRTGRPFFRWTSGAAFTRWTAGKTTFARWRDGPPL